mgnify:CR=1 FL=1
MNCRKSIRTRLPNFAAIFTVPSGISCDFVNPKGSSPHPILKNKQGLLSKFLLPPTMRQGIFHSPRPNDRNALLPRIIHRICRAALTACAVANANVAVIDHVAVPLEHASPRVTLGKIYHLIRPPFDGFIEQPVRFPPLFLHIFHGYQTLPQSPLKEPRCLILLLESHS